MRLKKILLVLPILALFLFGAAPAAQAAPAPAVYVNGVEQVFDVPPVIEDGVTLVPVRSVFETMNATVYWQPENKEIKVEKGDTTIKLHLDSKIAYVGLKIYLLDVAPKAVNCRTLAPLRFVAEALNADVEWDGKNNSIYIRETVDPKQPTAISLNKSSASIEVDGYTYLIADILPETADTAKVTWKSSDESVATVSTMGRVKGVKKGTAVITAATANGLEDKCVVNVTSAKSSSSGISIGGNNNYKPNTSDSKYYDSLGIENYTTVTGDKCRWTLADDGTVTKGFGNNGVLYIYDYNEASFNKYSEYLQANGWTAQNPISLKDRDCNFFHNGLQRLEMDYNKASKETVIKLFNFSFFE